MTPPLVIAQITDLHLGLRPMSVPNADRLRTVVALIVAAAPDLVLVTGDLTEDGDDASYQLVKSILEPLKAPILLAVGNHDRRDRFVSAFDQVPTADGFVQYERTLGQRRILVLDTLEHGRHGGAFCEVRADWLKSRLEQAPDVPTLIVLHHLPRRSGIQWMDAQSDGPWSERLAHALHGQDQVVALVCGHLHRGVCSSFAGHRVIAAPSVAPQVALDLAPLDPQHPDGRALIVDGPPGYALHHWSDDGVVSHFGSAGDAAVLARFDETTRQMVQALGREA